MHQPGAALEPAGMCGMLRVVASLARSMIMVHSTSCCVLPGAGWAHVAARGGWQERQAAVPLHGGKGQPGEHAATAAEHPRR